MIFIRKYAVPVLLVTGFIGAAQAQNPQRGLAAAADPAGPSPLKALLIAGGCCHDYENQHRIVSEGIQQRANIRVDVVWTRDTSHDPLFTFKDPDWAEGYDLILHDECAALKKDEGELANILKAHETIPAVHLHCAIHSFRGSDNNWHEHIGLSSDRHGPHVPVSVEFVNREHPITAPLEDWVTGKEELYNNVEVYGAEPLAMGTQTYPKEGQEVTDTAIVIWINTQFGAPSFSTSLGHFTHNVEDPRYLDLITRGALWACGKLDNPAYHTAYTGSNLIDELAVRTKESEEVVAAAPTAVPPENAVFAKLSASSVQADHRHYPWHAVDQDPQTRWCAAGPGMPAWLQVELEQPASLGGAEIEWEIRGNWMQYTLETSPDGKSWVRSFDASSNQQAGVRRDAFQAQDVRFVRVNILKQQSGMWPSLFELRLFGSEGKQLPLHPRIKQEQLAPKIAQVDPYKKAGNRPPRSHRLSDAEEKELLKDVTVPEGFAATLFAPWQMANYPTYVAASPAGDLYVASDGNASGGRSPGRGRVLRLRDTDQDGRADQVTEFVRDIDSPRGLLWDHDRLYLLHPPHITVFHDRDGDGVADSSKRLISNIAFGYQDRSADHTTNGLEMGIDGWIYVAVGDFGFMKATGTDGRELQLRGGGVVRFRPDGTGLELFSSGTRNIYGIAVTPTLDLFSRDNTNDGGGWDVRFHHHTGLEDHGYPRLYINFSDEIVAPLADYGGGSGVGGFYLGEPGIPDAWNDRPYTCDWGRQGSYRHLLEPQGASFRETAKPDLFIKMTRPTDADVDGLSAVYQASWKGPAQFSWGGEDHGYIVRVAPTGYTPEPLPDFEKLNDKELVAILRSSSSHVRRISAQRMLLRRPVSETITAALLGLAQDPSLDLGKRVAALYAITQRGLDSARSESVLQRLEGAFGNGDDLMPFVIRACGDLGMDLRTTGKPGPVPAEFFQTHLASESPRQILEAIVAAVRQGKVDVASQIASHLASRDPVLVHTAYRALARLGAYRAALAQLDSEDIETRKAASWALMRIHQPEVVDALLNGLSTRTDGAKRRTLIAILARLYHREAPWQGEGWGTRPDTRGPYYQLETWEDSARILAALNGILENPSTPTAEASFLVTLMGLNRIQNDQSLDRILTLAASDQSLLPTVIAQLAGKGDVPAQAIPLVLQAARLPESSPLTLQGAVGLLLTTDHGDAFPAVMDAVAALQQNPQAGKERDDVRNLFLASPKLENHYQKLEALFVENAGSPQGLWAAKGLLQLAHQPTSGPEAREACRLAIDRGWQDRAGRLTLVQASFWTRNPTLKDRIRAAMNDPDSGIAHWAARAAQRLGIQKPGADTTPKIAALQPEDAVVKAVAYTTGDVALGEAIFTRASCTACHTVRQDAPQKGPYLGSIAEIYRRRDLAEAILLPNKTIAQGFSTNLITLEDGRVQMGFVTQEGGENVSLRDIAGAEHTVAKSDIVKRDILPMSLMPAGLMQSYSVHELASLIDYLEAISAKED